MVIRAKKLTICNVAFAATVGKILSMLLSVHTVDD